MGSEHRDAILAAATETFARFGFKKTSIDDIARRAGIGKGTVYLHFQSKEELFAAAIHRIFGKAVADLEDAVKKAPKPAAKVRAFLEGRQVQHVQIAAELRISEEAVLELVALAEPHLREMEARETALLERIIEEGNAEGVFAVRNPKGVARGMSVCLHGLGAYLAATRSREVLGALSDLYEVFVRGMLAPDHARRTR
jgi:AcrR family transcriptional regulator